LEAALKKLAEHAGPIIVGIFVLAWVITVTLSGMDVNVFGVEWDFQRTALLGDSFGVLSSGMAGLAAYFAFATYKSAKDEAKIIARRAAEPSFLNLLERRFQMMENVMRLTSGLNASGARMNVQRGQIAIDWAAENLWHLLSSETSLDRRTTIYNDFVAESVGGLTNYHRYVYHIIAYAERQFAQVPSGAPMSKLDAAYSYIQLLRAQFSDSEMLLMAFNALYGAGNPKLKSYIERYALFNNMPDADIITFGLPDEFDDAAFGLLLEDRPMIVREWGAAGSACE
jgi:hypothetical protein